MPKKYSILRLVLAVLSIVMFSGVSYADDATPSPGAAMSRKEKLKTISDQINALESEKETGWCLAGGGIGAMLLGLVFIPGDTVNANGTLSPTGNAPLFYLLGVGGPVVAAWGAYTVWDASSQLGPLEAQKYDLSCAPIAIPDGGRAVAGLSIKVKFGS